MSKTDKTTEYRLVGTSLGWVALLVVVISVAMFALLPEKRPELISQRKPALAAGTYKVLYIDSYHKAYPPGVPMRDAVETFLLPKGVEVRYAFMDAKHKKRPEQQKQAALRIKQRIEEWGPDLLIAADDSASKYLVSPYYKETSLPVVFIGVNWDAGQYGFPSSNITGQVEVEMITQLVDKLREFASGPRIGILSGETLTDRNTLEYYKSMSKMVFENEVLVQNFDDWRREFKRMQGEVDILLLRNNAGIEGWDDIKAETFVQNETRVPTGTVSAHLSNFALISYAKVNREFGDYAAETAWKILQGESPANMTVTKNKQSRIILNMKLAKATDIRFPWDLIQNSRLISANSRKVLFVNSYHPGYTWSDDIEKGLLKAFNISRTAEGTLDTSRSSIDLKMFYMDSKRHADERYKRTMALKAKDIIAEWQPELVITSEDNAAKYLVAPYYMDKQLPVVFCGVNWDAAVYGFPTANITGMIEVTPVKQTIDMLRPYAKGDRVGIIGSYNLSNQKECTYLKAIVNVDDDHIELVKTFSRWKAAYSKLQDSVDILLWLSPEGIEHWDDQQALDIIMQRTAIPTGGTSDDNVRYALLGNVKIAEEQGWWAGKTAMNILDGTKPSDIMMTTNKKCRLYLNMAVGQALGIKFPLELMANSTLINPLQEPTE